jgi:ADP-ribosylglycohydrolase
MLGAIVGDVIGSYYEHYPTKRLDFDLFPDMSTFTDDTVLTVAVADWLLSDRSNLPSIFHPYVDRYPDAGYGASFLSWAQCGKTDPYNSWANGSAMRVSPVAYVATSIDEALAIAKESAEVTHDHPDGIHGAQAVAAAVYLAKFGAGKNEIQSFVETQFSYDCSRPLAEIRPDYLFDVSCTGSVPPAIRAFLESTDFESAIRNAISLGGDADTMACIAGAIAEPFYGGVPTSIGVKATSYLSKHLAKVTARFVSKFVSFKTAG